MSEARPLPVREPAAYTVEPTVPSSRLPATADVVDLGLA